MKILIFGGTTEGRLLAQTVAEKYKENHGVTVSVATPAGAHELAGIPGIQVLVGRLNEEEMFRLFQMDSCDGGCDTREDMRVSYDLVVDATHPYAVDASANIRRAAERAGLRYVRLVRTDAAQKPPASGEPEIIRVDSAASAAACLAGTEGRILVTTGSKELGAFAEIPAERLYVRVLPTTGSVAALEQAGIPYRNRIAMTGPFSREMNAATLRQYQIAWMVTKDSGKAGGFDEKMQACRDTGVRPVVIARPKESGLSMEEVLSLIDEVAESVGSSEHRL